MSLKHIASRTGIYGLGTILRSLSSFLLLPLYTSYLDPEDYGVVELLSIILDFTALLIGMRITEGIYKQYAEADDVSSKNLVISTSIILLGSLSLLAYFVLLGMSDSIASLLDAPEDFDKALAYFGATLIFTSMNEIFFSYMRILDKPVLFVSVNLLKLLIQITCNIYFIVYCDMTYWAIIYSALISSVVLSGMFAILFLPTLGVRFESAVAKKLLTFSYPIILSSFALYYITYGDRYFINYYHGAVEVGLYALAYKFGFLMTQLVWNPFMTYWDAQKYTHAKSHNADVFFGKIFTYLNAALLVIGGCIMLSLGHFLHLFSKPEYWSITESAPILIVAYIIQCWAGYHKFGILYASKTKYIAYSSYLMAALITILYLLLIPAYGALGAALATLIAFSCNFLYIFIISERYFHIQVKWAQIVLTSIALLAVVYAINLFSMPDIAGMIIKPLLFVLVSSILIYYLVFEIEDRRTALNLIFRRRQQP